VREGGAAGKRDTEIPSDLINSSAFHICSKKGVFSILHMDRHGVLTIIQCKDGEKLWLMYPHLTDDELGQWAESGNYSPNYRPFAVLLRPGDILIQKPTTVHAPYSLTDVLMTGTMHWDSPARLSAAQWAMREPTRMSRLLLI
jgi:hypothetical protein